MPSVSDDEAKDSSRRVEGRPAYLRIVPQPKLSCELLAGRDRCGSMRLMFSLLFVRVGLCSSPPPAPPAAGPSVVDPLADEAMELVYSRSRAGPRRTACMDTMLAPGLFPRGHLCRHFAVEWATRGADAVSSALAAGAAGGPRGPSRHRQNALFELKERRAWQHNPMLYVQSAGDCTTP